MCGFVTPLQGPEADEHRKPEVAETHGTTAYQTQPPASSLPCWMGGAGPDADWVRDGVSATPRTEPPPGPPQAVVLEGNYWKRRIEVVMREYHKWRIYYKKRVSEGRGGSPRPFPCGRWPPLLLEETWRRSPDPNPALL